MAREDPRRILLLKPTWRTACTILNIVPLPGLGAIIAGYRNPHSGLVRTGFLQLLLVVFGSWPLLFPGFIGLAWAVATAVRIHADSRLPPPWSAPLPGQADPPRPKMWQRLRRR